jgi:hypothetical protein
MRITAAIKYLFYKIKYKFSRRCKYLLKHKWHKVKPTERECQVAWRIGVHPLKDMHECTKCGMRGWLFPIN